MSQHKDEIRFRDMLDHAREAVSMVRGKKRSDLDSERMLELSLVRLVEIIGEAASRDLDELVKKGVVARYGTKRGVYYVLKEKMPQK